MEEKKSPLLVVLTPVRNEAWILRTFLEATSLWADIIIVSDQMSTDGSREIAAEFSKVRLIDNPNPEMHMADSRRLMFDEVDKIGGDKIVFTLDADEFLSGDFIHSDGWNMIINSEVGDVFDWRWMNLLPGCKKYTTWLPYNWASHVGEKMWEGYFPDNYIHESRIPWPNKLHREIIIEDFCSLHFARVNVDRQKNKVRFYQISTLSKNNQESGVRMYRVYHEVYRRKSLHDVPLDVFTYYDAHGINLRDLISSSDNGQYYLSESKRIICKLGASVFRKLDIWDQFFCSFVGCTDPRKTVDKIIRFYLYTTNNISKTFLIRAIDKILKKIY